MPELVQENAHRHQQKEGHSTCETISGGSEIAAPEFSPVSDELVDSRRRAEEIDYRQGSEDVADTSQAYFSPCGMTTSYMRVLLAGTLPRPWFPEVSEPSAWGWPPDVGVAGRE